MSMNMKQKIPFIRNSNHSVGQMTDDQKFAPSPGLNRINLQKHILEIKLELKTN